MKSFTLAKHRSWYYSAGMAVLISLWLLSGTIGNDTTESEATAADVPALNAPQSKVRVRTQSAEEIVRTIVVNAKAVFTKETVMPGFYSLEVGEDVRKDLVGKTILTAQQVEDVVAYLTTLK